MLEAWGRAARERELPVVDDPDSMCLLAGMIPDKERVERATLGSGIAGAEGSDASAGSSKQRSRSEPATETAYTKKLCFEHGQMCKDQERLETTDEQREAAERKLINEKRAAEERDYKMREQLEIAENARKAKEAREAEEEAIPKTNEETQ